jgi:hypothetical protein
MTSRGTVRAGGGANAGPGAPGVGAPGRGAYAGRTRYLPRDRRRTAGGVRASAEGGARLPSVGIEFNELNARVARF